MVPTKSNTAAPKILHIFALIIGFNSDKTHNTGTELRAKFCKCRYGKKQLF